MKRTSILLRATVPILLLLLAGCYTVLTHPTDIAVSYENDTGYEYGAGEAETATMGTSACSDCHFESEWLGYYDHPLIWDYPAYSNNAWWGDYYGRPWWYDEHWFDGSYSSGGSTGGRSWWERRSTERERTDDAPDYGLYPGARAPRTGGSASGSPSGSSSQSQTKQKAPESSKKKKKPRG